MGGGGSKALFRENEFQKDFLWKKNFFFFIFPLGPYFRAFSFKPKLY